MDEIDKELIALLCSKAGMLMEDYCAGALTLGSASVDEQKVALEQLSKATEKLKLLVATARSLSQ